MGLRSLEGPRQRPVNTRDSMSCEGTWPKAPHLQFSHSGLAASISFTDFLLVLNKKQLEIPHKDNGLILRTNKLYKDVGAPRMPPGTVLVTHQPCFL